MTKLNISRTLATLCFLLLFGGVFCEAKVAVPAIIGDNMVVQAGQKVRLWGTGDQGEHVSVSFAGATAETVAGPGGKWQVLIGPFKPGGPFELNIAGSNTLSFKNVLVGEVWVCSGQSNMEWPLASARGGPEAAAEMQPTELRLFTVRKNTSASELDDVPGKWVVASPESALQFSAVGYYFGRDLIRHLKVPVGLIHTSWGGTPAEAWTSNKALSEYSELKPILEKYSSEMNALPTYRAAYEKQVAEWNAKNTWSDPGNKGESLGYAKPEADLTGWKEMSLPKLWETANLKIDGAVWFRKEVDVPAGWTGKELTLTLGTVDDFETTYFNGVKVGGTSIDTPNAYQVWRQYKVDSKLVHPGKNTIAVRVFDRAGEGGFSAPGGTMNLSPVGDKPTSDAISLDGVWKYKVELQLEPKTPDWANLPSMPVGPDNPNSSSVLYNAMIAPLTPFSIRGAVWYQGESNASRAYQYRTLFPAMIKDWRQAWGEGNFPFYFVQLAAFQPVKPEPGESDWAELREAQFMTLKAPNTGMAVAIDIGAADTIHPLDKLDVGQRLALWALAKTYGEKIEDSGPLYKTSEIKGSEIRIKFSDAKGLASKDGSALKGFSVAGDDHKFVWASARIDGDEVVVSSPDVAKPVAVRYGWADNPVCNLVNDAGLPASPFRTDSWPGITVGK